MKLLDAIGLVAKADPSTGIITGDDIQFAHVRTAYRFLYGKEYSEAPLPVTKDVSGLVETLKLTGDNFALIGFGGNNTVYGNGDVVFRLQSPILGSGVGKGSKYVSVEDVPAELAANIRSAGEHQGIRYQVVEQLDTRRQPALKEIIPFLFKARDVGVVYEEPKPNNFGYDKQGRLKGIDLDHFYKLTPSQGMFESSVEIALDAHNFPSPVIACDDRNTYVVLDPKSDQRKKLLAGLAAVGVDTDAVEIIEKPLLLRIPRTEVTYGTPPHTERLADYADDCLGADTKAVRAAREFIKNLTHALGEDSEYSKTLPTGSELGAMSPNEFMEIYNRLMPAVEDSGKYGEAAIERIDGMFDHYRRATYPAPGRNPPG